MSNSASNADFIRTVLKSQYHAAPEEIAEYRLAFERGGWLEVLRKTVAGKATHDLQTAGSLAQLGEIDKAFEVLEEMASSRRVMILQANSDPRLDPCVQIRVMLR